MTKEGYKIAYKELKTSIEALKLEYIKANRKFQDGEIVDVYDSNMNYDGKRVIASCVVSSNQNLRYEIHPYNGRGHFGWKDEKHLAKISEALP